MNYNALLMTTLQSLIGVGIAVLVPVLMKYILSKTSKENLVRYTAMANMVVLSVQQTMGSASLEERKKAAEGKLSTMTKGILNVDDIEQLIESAVFLMKQQFDLAVTETPTFSKAPSGVIPAVDHEIPKVPTQAPVESPVG